jgi:hypothetical protein
VADSVDYDLGLAAMFGLMKAISAAERPQAQ